MKTRGGAAGIQAGGRKLLRPPSLPHLSNTTLCLIHGCVSMSHSWAICKKKKKQKKQWWFTMAESKNIAIGDDIDLYILHSHATTLLKLPCTWCPLLCYFHRSGTFAILSLVHSTTSRPNNVMQWQHNFKVNHHLTFLTKKWALNVFYCRLIVLDCIMLCSFFCADPLRSMFNTFYWYMQWVYLA